MALRIQTNTLAMNGQRGLTNATDALGDSVERLSSGYRVNRAADDAAGLAISERLKADIRGLNMAKRNASDGISLVQTAEGALNEIANILTRLRELSIQGASDTIGLSEREFINKEVSALKDEVDRITYSTEFNGTLLLVGDGEAPEGMPPEMLANFGRFPLEIQVGKNWHASTDSVSGGGDFGRNPINIIRLNLQEMSASATGLGLGMTTDESVGSVGTFIEGDVNASKIRAQNSIQILDKAIETVSGNRAAFGAVENRLNAAISNLSVETDNFSMANSRIRDTDYAEESSIYAKNSIVQQASTAMLAQANQIPAIALKLLG